MNVVAIDSRRSVRREPTLRYLREYSHLALKGQVLVEEALTQVISEHCRAAHVLDGVAIDFHLKVKLARALAGDTRGATLWELVWRLYRIRNEMAHRLESHEIHPLIEEFVQIASAWSRESSAGISSDGDVDLARGFAESIESLLAALAAIEPRGQESRSRAECESR